MADIESNIRIGVDTTDALASIKELQRQISAFQKQLQGVSAQNNAKARDLQRSLISDINATGKFTANIKTIRSGSESFTNALEKNKLSMGEYFRFATASTRNFGGVFKKEFNTIEEVARDRVKTLQTQYISLGREAGGALKAISVRPLKLDLNDLATQQAITSQKQQIFNQLLRQGSTNLLNFGKNTQWAGRQLMVGFTIPLSIFGTTAAKTFMELEEQSIRFRRVYGELFTPPEETDQMLSTLRELGEEFTKYGVAVKDTLSLAADAAAMGQTGAALAAQVSEATRLAVLGEVAQQQALETTISLTNAFGIATEELAGKIDFLNAVENQTVVSIEDLTVAIPKAGPVIKQLGGGVEDLAFFLTAMKEGGINASEGANALKSGLASLINPTQEASIMLQGFGINLKDIVTANAGNVKGVVLDFASALDTLNPLQRAQAIEQLFGKFQFARLSSLFQNVIAEGSQASRILELTNATTSELAQLSAKELRKVEESTTFRFRGAIEEFKNALAPIGEEFMKLVTPLIEFGTRVLKAFDGMSDSAKGFVTGLVAILGGIAPVALMTFGLLANGVANIMKGFAAVRNIFLGVGKQSDVLGEQIDYMTNEQLQAASAAASLDQVHMELRQTFTAEAEAVDMLTAAYRRAVAAGTKLTGVPAIKSNIAGSKPRKMKDGGVVMVPGSGKGDKVPAMLEPGEAVIPSEMTKKYSALIQGMIAGKIPGYVKGKPGSSKKLSPSDIRKQAGLYKAPEVIRQQTVSMDWSTLDAEIKAVEDAAKGMLGESQSSFYKIQNLIQKQASHIKPDVTKTQIAGADMDIKNWVSKNLVPDTGYVNNYLNAIQQSSTVLENFKKTNIDKAAKRLGMTVQEVEKELVKLKKGIHPTTRKSASVLLEVAKTDDSYQGKALQAGMTERLKGDYYETMGNRKYDPSLDEKAEQQTKKRIARAEALAKAQEEETKSSKKASATTKKKTKVEEENAEAKKEETKEVKRRTATSKSQKASPSASAPTEKITTQATQRVASQSLTAAKTLQSMNTKVLAASGILSTLSVTASMFGADLGAAGEALLNVTNALFALSLATGALTSSTKVQASVQAGADMASMMGFGSQKGKGAAKAKMTVAKDMTGKRIAGGVKGGKVGAIFNNLGNVAKAVVGPLGTLGKIALRAVPFIGAAFLAFEAFKFVSNIIKEQEEKITGLGDAAFMSAEKMKAAADLLGFEVINQPGLTGGFMEQGTASASSQSQKSQIAELRGSEDFKTQYSAEINAVKNATAPMAEQALQSLAIQMATSGAPAEAVDALVKAIAQEAGQTSLNLDFTAIDISTADGLASVKKLADDAVTSLNAAFATGFTPETQVEGAYGEMNTVAAKFSDDLKKQAQVSAGAISSTYFALSQGLANQSVSAEDFVASISEIESKLNGLDAAELALIVPEIAKKLDLGDAFKGLEESRFAITALSAAAAGIQIPYEDMQLFKAAASDTKDAETLRAAAMLQAKYNKEIKNGTLAKYQQAQADAEIAMINEQVTAATIDLATQTANMQNQTAAYQQLIQMGYDTETAYNLATNAVLATGIAAALAGNNVTGDLAAIQAQIDAMLAAQKTLPKAPSGGGSKKKSAYDEAIDSLKEQRTEAQNTITAFNRLRDAQFEIGDAAKAAEDPILAAALATTKVGSAAWDKLLDRLRKVNGLLTKGEIKNLLIEGKMNIQLQKDAVGISSALTGLGYSFEQIQNILSDEVAAKALAKDLEDGKINSKNMLNYLSQIKQMKALDIQLKMTTPEGMQSIFDEGYSKAMEAFDVKAQKIELDFAVKNADDLKKIEDTQQKIEAINYKMDDFDAQLVEVEAKEEEVNKKYDTRLDALNRVDKINKKIAQQQKSQLTIADALAQGDIAGAARAAQEQRAQEAQQAIEDQKTALEESRQKALSGITAASGLTRAEIELEIKDLKDQIFKLEEETLEPAQERVRLAEIQKQIDIDSLTVMGKTKTQWETIKNDIDTARINSQSYKDAMQAALDIVNDLVDKWNNQITDKTVTLTIIEKRLTADEETVVEKKDTVEETNKKDVVPIIPTGGNLMGNITIAAETPAEREKMDQAKANTLLKGALNNKNTAVGASTQLAKNAGVISQTKTPAKNVNTNTLAGILAASKPTPTKSKLTTSADAAERKINNLPTVPKNTGGGGGGSVIRRYSGGIIPKRMGKPKFFKPIGTDSVPAMLTPGEFVVSKPAVQRVGLEKLKGINNGKPVASNPVYNYDVSISVKSDANPDQIARTVMDGIRRVESQKIRGNRLHSV